MVSCQLPSKENPRGGGIIVKYIYKKKRTIGPYNNGYYYILQRDLSLQRFSSWGAGWGVVSAFCILVTSSVLVIYLLLLLTCTNTYDSNTSWDGGRGPTREETMYVPVAS